MKKNFDQKHKAKTLTPLREGVTVWIPDHKCMGKVINKVGPRSYQVKTKFGSLRRNCCHITALPDEPANVDDENDLVPDFPSMRSRDTVTNSESQLPFLQPAHRVVYTKSGRASKPSDRLTPDNN